MDYTFAAALKAHRTRRGLTQGQLAAAAGLTLNHISRLELGQRSPSFDVACKLADALKITVNHFRR